MDDYNIDPIEDFAVTYATQDEVDCERDILGTTPMSALSPAFRELYDEYTDDEEEDDYIL
jgi:hypothetical protein